MIKKSCSISLWKWSAISAVGLFLVGCSQNQESVEPVFTQEEIDSQSDSIAELSVESPKPVVEKSKNESVRRCIDPNFRAGARVVEGLKVSRNEI